MPRAQVEAALEQMFGALRARLGMAAPAAGAGPARERMAPAAPWAGWVPLQRRLKLLQQDAEQVALGSVAIDEALGRGGQGQAVVKDEARSG